MDVHTVTVCPPGNAKTLPPEPPFKRRARMISTDSRLTFADCHTMHVDYHKGNTEDRARWVPEFAVNDSVFRAVVRKQAVKYINLGPIPDGVSLEQLIAACNWRTRGIEFRAKWVVNPRKQYEMYQHVGACERAGSYISLLNYVGYQSWRRCEDSVTVANLTGYLTPTCVRQMVSRLARTARDMGFETRAQHNRKPEARKPSSGRPRGRRKGFKFRKKEEETAVVAGWRYFLTKTKQQATPPEMTEQDVTELVKWRQEGWKIQSGWAEGKALTTAQNCIDKGDRILNAISGLCSLDELESPKESPKVCTVPECGRKHASKGFCHTHYARLKNHGDVVPDRPIQRRAFRRNLFRRKPAA